MIYKISQEEKSGKVSVIMIDLVCGGGKLQMRDFSTDISAKNLSAAGRKGLGVYQKCTELWDLLLSISKTAENPSN